MLTEKGILSTFDLTEWKCIFIVWKINLPDWFLFLYYSINDRSSSMLYTACFHCPEDDLQELECNCFICTICFYNRQRNILFVC